MYLTTNITAKFFIKLFLHISQTQLATLRLLEMLCIVTLRP
jgi:hypothetical protein